MPVDWEGARDCLIEIAAEQIKVFLAEREPIEQVCAFGLYVEGDNGTAFFVADTINHREREYKKYGDYLGAKSLTEWSANMGNWRYAAGILEDTARWDDRWEPFKWQIAEAHEDLFYEVDVGYKLYKEIEIDHELADEFHHGLDERCAFPVLEEVIRRDLLAPKTKELIYLISEHDDMPEASLAVICRFEDFKSSLNK